MNALSRPSPASLAKALQWMQLAPLASTTTISKQLAPAPRPWICMPCRRRYSIARSQLNRRHFSASARLTEVPRTTPPTQQPTASTDIHTTIGTTTDASQTTPTAPLPSHTDKERWIFSKRMTALTDSILARASIAGQHINAYTGTDYSGIEALRRSIETQEETVRTRHGAADDAKRVHAAAAAAQTAAAREIVALLERKASWSPADLDRYMALVRSEHLHDKAVLAAADGLGKAERALEEARAGLERLERQQYHEEQIWSDTIRRNSTWVTFGLMGINILLLLAQIAIFEPNRRRKIVRDVKRALDEKVLAVPGVGGTVIEETESKEQGDLASVMFSADNIATEDDVLTLLQTLNDKQKQLLSTAVAKLSNLSPTPPLLSDSESPLSEFDGSAFLANTRQKSGEGLWTWELSYQAWRQSFLDLFSDRLVQTRKLDITATALEGLAAGAAIVGMLVVLSRSS